MTNVPNDHTHKIELEENGILRSVESEAMSRHMFYSILE